MMETTGTVYVVDDDPEVQESVKFLMESVGLRVSTHSSAREFFAAYDDASPACLILDLRMPEMSGLEAHELLRSKGIDLPVIVVTGHGDVPAAVRAMKLGAMDFLEKPCSDHILLEKVQRAIELDGQRRADNAKLVEIEKAMETLSRRERDVMELIVDGKSNKEVARALNVSPKTIESHRANLMRKVGAGSLAELVQYVMLVSRTERRRAE